MKKKISSKNTFNEKAKNNASKPKIKAPRNYDAHEVEKKLDNYTAVAIKKEHKGKMKQIKNNYLEAKKYTDYNSGARSKFFEDGKKVGLHYNVSETDFQKSAAKTEQAKRNKTVKEAKEFYHRNYSLKVNSQKYFPNKVKQHKNKNVSKDKG
ncbi:MAG: hypothetical protein P1U70_06160 [Saprospiraceae bacterium]|jgi:hypothetical protein|nr:hypothetical protein [Saprospiraceae bacterium]